MKLLEGKSILVVDDEIDFCEVLAEEIQAAGAQVKTANSGNQAISAYSKDRFDMVVSDVNMPDGDGMDLLKHLSQSAAPTPLLLFITGYSKYPAQDLYDAGAAGLMQKPCNLDELIEMIARLILPIDQRLKSERIAIPEHIVAEITIHDLPSAAQQKIVNISRGGAFIARNQNFPKAEQAVKFSIRIEVPTHGATELSGWGVCRWVRTKIENNLPTGFGLEFMALDSPSLELFLKIIKSQTGVSYIPKT